MGAFGTALALTTTTSSMAPPGFSFFSSKSTSKPGASKSGTNVVVTTRVVQRTTAGSGSSSSSGAQVVARQATPQFSGPSRPSSAPKDAEKKRKGAANTDAIPPPAKKHRPSPSPIDSRAPSITPSLRASVPSSRHSSLAPVAEELLSRAGSVLPEAAASNSRACWTEEDGRTRDLLSCEQVIRNMVKTYKACE